MITIKLTSRGQWGERTKDVTPKDINELIEEVVDIAYGYHCDYDSVTADIVSGDDIIRTYEQNLLYVGYNCEDGITQCEDGTYYDEYLERRFNTYDDALKENTKLDFSGDITSIYMAYCELK